MHNKYFPKVKIKKGYSNRKPWLSEALRNSIKIKNKLYYVYKKTQSVKNELAYKIIKLPWANWWLELRSSITMIFLLNIKIT